MRVLAETKNGGLSVMTQHVFCFRRSDLSFFNSSVV
jgi:hypothetical protein